METVNQITFIFTGYNILTFIAAWAIGKIIGEILIGLVRELWKYREQKRLQKIDELLIKLSGFTK